MRHDIAQIVSKYHVMELSKFSPSGLRDGHSYIDKDAWNGDRPKLLGGYFGFLRLQRMFYDPLT